MVFASGSEEVSTTAVLPSLSFLLLGERQLQYPLQLLFLLLPPPVLLGLSLGGELHGQTEVGVGAGG